MPWIMTNTWPSTTMTQNMAAKSINPLSHQSLARKSLFNPSPSHMLICLNAPTSNFICTYINREAWVSYEALGKLGQLVKNPPQSNGRDVGSEGVQCRNRHHSRWRVGEALRGGAQRQNFYLHWFHGGSHLPHPPLPCLSHAGLYSFNFQKIANDTIGE